MVKVIEDERAAVEGADAPVVVDFAETPPQTPEPTPSGRPSAELSMPEVTIEKLEAVHDAKGRMSRPWNRQGERQSIGKLLGTTFEGAAAYMKTTEEAMARAAMTTEERGELSAELLRRIDDCYAQIDELTREDATRAPANLDDVGTFPLKFDCPPEVSYPRKLPKPYMELYDNKWWFLRIFAHRHLYVRFLLQLWPNLAFLVAINLCLNGMSALGVKPPNFQEQLDSMQVQISLVLSLLLVFRTNSAYERYYEGKRAFGVVTNQIRQIIMNAHAFLAFHEDESGHLRVRERAESLCVLTTAGSEAQRVHELRERVRRQANVLLALLRQDLREKRCGFVPDSNLKDVPYSRHTWILDPSRPRLVDMLTPREVAAFGGVSSGSRVMLASHNLMDALQRLAPSLAQDKPFTECCTRNVQELLDASKTCQRIVDTPLPFTYTLILGVLLFLFVYSTPVVYWGRTNYERRRWYEMSGLLPSVVTAIFFYGVMQIAIEIENPFNFADVDHDLDEFAKKLHEETLAIAKAVAPRGAKCRDYWPTPRVHLDKFSGEGYRRKFSASTTFRD